MKTLENSQIEFFVEILISSAFHAVDCLIEGEEDADDVVEHALTQLGRGLSTLYSYTQSEDMGVDDALDVEFLSGENLDGIVRNFANKKVRLEGHKLPDTEFLARHWTNKVFNDS